MLRKTITIGEVYKLFNKYGDLNLNVNTPYGFKKIEACDITAHNSSVIEVCTELYKLKCSPNHKIKTNNGKFVKVLNLLPGSIIQTKTGNEKIKSITLLSDKYDLYDIQVQDVKQYYSNGILSHNSSLFDVVTYIAYDKCSRAWKAKDVLNNQKTKFKGQLELELAGESYIIERNGFQSKTGSVRVEVNFYKIDLNGNKILMNGQDRDQTNKLIRDCLGTYDDFLLTTLSTQNDNKNFIFKSQKERKELLYSFLDLSVFEELHNIAKKYIKAKSAELLYTEVELYNDEYSTLSNDEHELITIQSRLEQSFQNKQALIQEKQLQLDVYNKELTPLSVSDIEFTSKDEQEVTRLNNKLQVTTIKIEDIDKIIQDLNDTILTSETLLMDSMYAELPDKLAWREEVKLSLSLLQSEFNSCVAQIEHTELKLDKLKTHEYDPNCIFCIKNEFVQDAKLSEKELPTLKETYTILQEKIQVANNNLDDTTIFVERQKKVDEVNSALNLALKNKNDLINQRMSHMNEKTTIENQLTQLNKIKDQFEHHKESIEKNLQIKKLIDILTEELKEVNKELLVIQGEITVNKANLIVIENKKQRKAHLENVMRTLKPEVAAYNMYIDMTHNDGLPYMILQKILPVIESEVNIILNDVVDFYVKFESDEKCNINCYLLYSNENCWPVEMASGMERFMISLAIRCSLVEITNLPRPSFMAIDEGFGVLDSERISSLSPLFDYMRSKFDFVVVVSHVDTMRDMVDGLLDVHKNKQGFSEISVL